MPIEIVRTQETNRYDKAGNVVREVLVTYWPTDADGPYTMRFPEGTDVYTIRQKLQDHADELAKLRGA